MRLFNKKGLGAVEGIIVLWGVITFGLMGVRNITGADSIRELAGDPCENSEYAQTGTGSYTCTE